MKRLLAFFFALLSLSLLIPSCTIKDPAGDLGTVVVGVTGDLRVGVDFDKLHVVMIAGGETLRDEVLDATSSSKPLTLPFERAFEDRPDGEEVEILFEAFFPGNTATPLVTRLASTTVVAGRKLLLKVFLDSRCVVLVGGGAPTCEAPETCIAGACASSEVDSKKLPAYDPSWSSDGASDACKKPGAGAPEVFVGQGQSDYLPMMDGEVAQVEAGPQGGHHVWTALRMKNLKQSGSITSITGHLPELNQDVGPFNVVFTFDQDEGGYCKLAGLRFQLDLQNPIEPMLGKQLDITVTVKDKDGDVGTGHKSVMLSSSILK